MTTCQSLCPTDLITVFMTLGSDAPHVTLLRHDQNTPTFEESHHSLQKSLRHWAEQRTECPIGHMEQLYTFSTFPMRRENAKNPGSSVLIPHIHITYLALSHARPPLHDEALYQHFPWEDRRSEDGNRQLLRLVDAISQWGADNEERITRIAAAFGLSGLPWDDTRVLERYELLWESGLVPRDMPSPAMTSQPDTENAALPREEKEERKEEGKEERKKEGKEETEAEGTNEDIRRLLATALSRLRARIRYSPAVFDLLPGSFTLLHLQQAMETVSGRYMHKPNFRRLVLHQQLVEETGELEHSTAGRPARLYRFRPAAMASCYLGAAFLPLETPLAEERQTIMTTSHQGPSPFGPRLRTHSSK